MKPFLHTLLLLGAVTLAYIWLQFPSLTPYSLQAFAFSLAGFLIIKRFKSAKLWHILPEKTSAEMALLTFSFLLLIGATGNIESWLFPLGFIHLFFLVLSSHVVTAVMVALAVLLFHMGLEPTLSTTEILHLVNIPLMLIFFLFAKLEYDEAFTRKQQVQKVQNQEQTLESFIAQFLQPKLTVLEELAREPNSQTQLTGQISLMQAESEKVLSRIKSET